MRKARPHASRGAWGRLFGALVLLAAGSTGCIDIGVPQWSPDGRRIVYARAGLGDPEVRLVDLDKGEPPVLVAADAYRPRWSPDGGLVYFLETGGFLRACRPDGTDVRQVAAGVSWYEPSPDGQAIYYLRDRDGAVVELVTATGRAESITPEGAGCSGAALGPGGILAYATPKEKRGKKGHEIRLVDLAEGGGERVLEEFVRTADEKGEDAGLLLIFRAQTAELVALRSEGAERIHVVPLTGKRARTLKIEKLGSVVTHSVSPDGAYLHLTDVGDDAVTSRRVDLAKGRSEVLAKSATALVGGHGWAPGGGAVAEHSPAGLLVREADGAWERYYPVTADEYIAAARTRAKQGRADEAVDILEEASSLRDPGIDRQRLGLVAVDALLSLGRRKEAAEALLEAWLLHPVSDADAAAAAGLFERLRRDDRLVDAIHGALEKEPGERAKPLGEAVELASSPGLVAGLRFRIGEAEFAAKSYREAGKMFRLASETEGFPAADYAAALAGGAHFVSGRNDRYAEELFLKAIDFFPASALGEDLRRALSFVRENRGAVIRRTAEASHESGATAWVTMRATRSMRWSLVSGAAGRPTGQPPAARFELDVDRRAMLSVARADQPAKKALAGLSCRLGELSFSPSGDRLAFLVGPPASAKEGAVWTDVFVVDLDGNVILGDRKALDRPPEAGGRRITGCAWDATGSTLLVREDTVDARGGRRPRERRVRVPRVPNAAGAAPRPRR